MCHNKSNENIDIVIPWVDPSDIQWQKDKALYSNKPLILDSKEEKYYRDWNTLLYLFRSIDVNMPWVNKIHFITYGHLPQWLNTSNPKLIVHNHSSFFKEGHAFPVFSSDAIEMNIGNLPDLSEKFIYFNDDEIVVKPVEPSRFFRGKLPVDFLIQDIPRGGWLYKLLRTKDVYPDICKNCIRPLNDIAHKNNLGKLHFYNSSYSNIDKLKNFAFNSFKKYYWIIPNHSPQPLLKSTIKICESLFPSIIQETANSRFRTNKDICHYLFRNYNLLMGKFYPQNFHDSHCIVLQDLKKSLEEIKNITKYTFVCINDSEFLTHQGYLNLKPLLEKKLEELFPDKSNYEL